MKRVRFVVLLAMVMAGVISVMAAAMERPTHVVKSRGTSYEAFRLDREGKYERHARIFVPAGDSIYPIAEEYASRLTKNERQRYHAGMIRDIPVIIHKDFVDELVWDGQSAKTTSSIDRQEKKDAKARFNQLIYGENRVSGNVWYYLLGFFIATFIISRIMKIDSSQSEEKPVQSGAALLVGAVALAVLFAVEYGFCFFGMSNNTAWLRGERGNEFLNTLYIVPKCLCFVVLVIWQFRLWYDMMVAIGKRIDGRKDYSLTVLIVSLAVAAIGVALFFFVKQLPAVMYVSSALVAVDLLLLVYLNRRDMPLAALTVALYIAGVMAMFELLAIFGLLLVVVIAIITAVASIITLIQNPGKITHLVRVDGRVIGRVFAGSKTVYFDNGTSAGMSEIHSTRIKIDPKE